MNRLRQFWHYTTKVFHLPARLRALQDRRSQPAIPTRVFSASLLLGVVLRTPSLLPLQAHTERRGWRQLVHWPQTISDDAFGYVRERYRSEDWRAVRVDVNRTLKANKAFASAKVHGLLVVSLDANEQFHSRCRCCAECGQRTVTVQDATGQTQPVNEYYRRQVYAQMQGSDFSVILDVEPIRPGGGRGGGGGAAPGADAPALRAALLRRGERGRVVCDRSVSAGGAQTGLGGGERAQAGAV